MSDMKDLATGAGEPEATMVTEPEAVAAVTAAAEPTTVEAEPETGAGGAVAAGPAAGMGELGSVRGRPVEDRVFEAVETGAGFAVGVAVGAAVGGPVGAAVGGLLGAASGLVAGEVMERVAGSAATSPEVAHGGMGVAAGPRERSLISYPSHYLLGVADSVADAAAAVAALTAAGFAADGAVRISGPDEIARLRDLGPHRGPVFGLVRGIQSMTMDQVPDFKVYEEAVQSGRTVVGLRVMEERRIPAARDVLLGAGLYFLNFYGRWSTSEVARWSGRDAALVEHHAESPAASRT